MLITSMLRLKIIQYILSTSNISAYRSFPFKNQLGLATSLAYSFSSEKISKSSFSKKLIVQSKFEIVDKKSINHDCYLYYLKWAGPKFIMSIGQHFRIIENIPTYEHPEGEQVIRKYTPISPSSQQDLIELLVKIYRPNSNPQYPQGGKLTPYLQKLKIGDLINIDGPYGKFSYKPGGILILNGKQMKKTRIFFIAGGSGITPCYQTIKQILKLPNQNIELILLYANKSEADIVLRKQLQQLQPRLKLHYTLDKCPDNWNYFSGYPTKQLLQKVCPLNDPDTLYVHCGPRGMNVSIRQIFEKNFPQSTIFKY